MPIAVLNESTALTDAEVESYIPAFQTQVSQHFGPIWGATAELVFYPKNQAPPGSSWQVVFLDTSDQAGALGYHDLTAANQPLSKIFAGSDKQYGYSSSVTGSHEIMEMLADPGINATYTVEDNQGNLVGLLAREVADAPEDDQYSYEIGGVKVSDFVYPAWFGGIEGTKFDYCGHITKAGQILSGGYIGYWTPSGGWTQQTGSDRMFDPGAAAPIGSRRERRARGKANWVVSRPVSSRWTSTSVTSDLSSTSRSVRA